MNKNEYILTYVLHIVTYTGECAELVKIQNVWAENPLSAANKLVEYYKLIGNPYSSYYIPEVTDVTQTIEITD